VTKLWQNLNGVTHNGGANAGGVVNNRTLLTDSSLYLENGQDGTIVSIKVE